MTYARIVGTGSYLPERVLTNAELAPVLAVTKNGLSVVLGFRLATLLRMIRKPAI